MSKFTSAWGDIKESETFKKALMAKLQNAEVAGWGHGHWHDVAVIYGPTAIRVELAAIRSGFGLEAYPVFAGRAMVDMESILIEPSELGESTAGLKEYEVRVSHDVVEETTVMVMAASPEEAIAKARKEDLLNEATWSLTDAIGDNQFEIVES